MAQLLNPNIRRLRYIIAESGKPLYAIAKSLDISAATLSNISNGISEPSATVRKKLANHFGESADSLLKPLFPNGVTFD